MPRWKSTVKLGDLHAAHEDGRMDAGAVGRALAGRLRRNPYAAELEEQIELLEAGVSDVDEYDEVLAELYDFGDAGHRIWFDPTGGER